MDDPPQSPAANGTVVSCMSCPVQIVKIKRHRDTSSDVELETLQRTQRMRKLSKETVLQFKSLALVDSKPRKQGRTKHRQIRIMSRNLKWPLLARMVHKQKKATGNKAALGPHDAYVHGRSRRKKNIVDTNMKDRIQRFLPYRQKAFPEEHFDYLVTVYNQIFPDPDQNLFVKEPSVNEELIAAYKSSTSDKERKLLRKHFAVVRAMVAAEEGKLSDVDTSDGSIDEEEYDYYVEHDPLHFDQFLDEEGNLVEGITFEVDEDDYDDPDSEFYTGNDYPSDCSDSVKDCFGTTDEDEFMTS